ncbi:MAG: hypothetical protein E6I15_15355 [Chloroflexi bacterium]|nr:MAG: hypothetical protein E6I15_15355 [Chloroflexota bacterium]
MDAATSQESVAAFVEETLAGSGWQLHRVRRRGTRLEPPDWYWTTFALDINKDGEERSLRLVAKGALNPAAWEKLKARLSDASTHPCDPIDGVGTPRLFPDTQHAYWFYPYDPRMPDLPLATDPVRVASILFASILFGFDEDATAVLALARRIAIERVRYTPEIGAILCYTIDLGGQATKIYGKVQPGHRGLRTYRIVQGLWRAAARYPGYLNLPRPLGYVEQIGLLLEEGVRGRPVSSKRTSSEFALMSGAAAEALAVIHESGVENDERIEIEREIARLDRVVEQFAYVLPQGHFLLKDLVTHMRERVRRTTEEEWLPTHGDLKYDQFVFHNDPTTNTRCSTSTTSPRRKPATTWGSSARISYRRRRRTGRSQPQRRRSAFNFCAATESCVRTRRSSASASTNRCSWHCGRWRSCGRRLVDGNASPKPSSSSRTSA